MIIPPFAARRPLLLLAGAVCLLSTARDIEAQHPSPPALAAWVGRSVRTGEFRSTRHLFAVFVAGFQYRRWVVGRGPARVEYVAEVLPAIVVLDNYLGDARLQNGRWAVPHDAPRGTTYGAALVPIGVRLAVAPLPLFEGFVTAGAGLARFDEPIPVRNAHRSNVIGRAGGGVTLRLGGGWGAEAGFTLQHVSNAGLSPVNPALESTVIHIAVVRSRGW